MMSSLTKKYFTNEDNLTSTLKTKITNAELLIEINNTIIEYHKNMQKYVFRGAIENILHLSHIGNNYMQKDYFWQFWFFGSLIIIYSVLPVIYKYFVLIPTYLTLFSDN